MTAAWRRVAVLLLLLVACALQVGASQASGAELRPQDNVATALTEQDGTSTFELAWEVRKERGDVVDPLNQAQAGARCSDCRATAIAFQIVLVEGQAERLLPVNRSLAFTDQCTRCVVYAGARQFVRVVDGHARFTPEGRLVLVDVRRDLAALEGRTLTADELAAEVDTQKARVLDVLQHEVVVSERPSEEADVLTKRDDSDDAS